MARLTAKQESFVEMMKKSEEHATKGFELLSRRPHPEVFFDALEKAGFFEASKAPGIIEAREPGYYQVPYWPALDYLQAVSDLAGKTNDTDLARKIVGVIRDVSKHDQPNNSLRDNYHTFRKFADFFGVLPLDVITLEIVDLLPSWLCSRFERGTVARAIDEGILPRLLDSDHEDDWKKACRILWHCTAIGWAKSKGFREDIYEPTSVIDAYWLAELVKNHTPYFSAKVGPTAAEIFLERLREISNGRRGHTSSIWRPAIEDHEQNRSFNETENILVDGLRNVVLGWIDKDTNSARPFVQRLMKDDLEIAKRIGIHILNEHWSILKELYSDVMTPEFFDSGTLHEVHVLLRKRFSELESTVQDKTLDALRRMTTPKKGPEGEDQLKRLQRRLLTAIIDKDYQPADEWFRDLSTELGLEGSPNHPDFHFYTTVHRGPSPSLFEPQELVSFAEKGTIVEMLNAFKRGNEFGEWTIEALVKALEEAVQQSPDVFLMWLPTFATAKRPYQYGVINGFKRLWDSSEEKHQTANWVKTWPILLSMFEEILDDPDFWDEHVERPQGLSPTHDWIPPLIADFLQAGTKSDDKAYSPKLLPQGYRLIQILLEKFEPETLCPDDPTDQAINSSKGRAILALVHHALRACRISDKESGGHRDVWNELRSVFDSELSKCQDANYEYSTLAAQYLPNLMYLDSGWVQNNIKRIFPVQYVNNLMCALDGIAYTNISKPLYKLLVDNGIIDTSLPLELKGRHARKRLIVRITLAYLWGDETLDSSRFAYLFDPGRTKDLRYASSFLSRIGRTNLTEEQTERILEFWGRCLEWSRNKPKPPVRILADLSRLILHLDSIGKREFPWLLEVAPYVHIDLNSDHFYTELVRLADSSPAEVLKIIGRTLDTTTPIYDHSDKLKLLLNILAGKGCRDEVIQLVNKYRETIPGAFDLYKELIANQ